MVKYLKYAGLWGTIMSDLLKKLYGIPEPWEDGLDVIPDYAPAPNYDVGDIIGEQYEVKECLHGAMGDVYHCLDKRRNSDVALKTIISTGKTERAYSLSFASEINRMLQLPPHPNILTLQRIDAIDGYYYLVTEWIRGHSEYGNSLSEWLKAKRFTCAEIINFMQQLTCGLLHCHRHLTKQGQPYVFGDLKPDNILINQSSILKLGDFSGGYTKDWCAPEFRADSKDTPDERSDIFGIGRIALEMAGRTDELDSEIYDSMDKVIGKCLEDSMDSRFQSFQELLNALGEICQRFSLTPYDESQNAAAPFLDHYNRTVSAVNMGYESAIYEPLKDNARITYAFAHGRIMSMNEYMESTSPIAQKLYHAKTYFLQGDYGKALQELQDYTANSDVLHLKAAVLRTQMQFDEAINHCLCSLLLTDHLLSYDLIGTVLLERPDLYLKYRIVAQTLLHKLTAIEKRRLTGYLPYQALAKFHMLCGDSRYASSYFRKCLRFYNPGGDWYNLYLYAVCELRQNPAGASAKQILDIAIEQIRSDASYRESLYKSSILFYCINMAGYHDEAVKVAKEINEIYGIDLRPQIRNN